MNAAFLLVTSTLLVGQGGDKKVEAVPAPAKSATGSSAACGHGCHDGFGLGLRDKLRSLFQHDNCNNCKPSIHDRLRTLFHSNCNTGCKPKIWNWQPHCLHQNRAPATCNDPCNHGGLNFLEKLRSAFHRGDRCCAGGTAGPAKIDSAPPKQMPKEAPKGARIETAPAPAAIVPNAIPSVPSVPNVPSVEVAPAPVPMLPIAPPAPPRVDDERRDPF